MQWVPQGLWKIELALTVGTVVALCAGCGSSSLPRAEDVSAAQANLQTALAGARAFYASNGDSYAGITAGEPPTPAASSIVEIDTGLRYVPGQERSTGPDVVSMYSPDGSVLLIVAYEQSAKTCLGVLSLKQSRDRPYFSAFPSTVTAGTYYFRTGAANCLAATTHPTALGTTGFPTT